ncbi:MAG: hypothetical protein JO359_06920 [Candidatus Eremiobacteraeota bacterium]|nr:hypothetical protein [Candidatus Eremiobacteraeota bacterium]
MSSERYATHEPGVLTERGLLEACRHVWRDSNSTVMLGGDVLNYEPVSYDDKHALAALKAHIAAAGPQAFREEILPKLGFGPPAPAGRAQITCAQCGNLGEQLHLGCNLCEDCCDCRP